ncbi:uncharacterized protein LOC106458899 [Limulus polyphemus]|uniref:Uncharacterized protein LOC106458899 n=1 Tax=Limulus polyphemus TaxID=6850 RepID=A0ABM1B399_LIMPO|nr:uncharacterized protein LOC106458899 [Limulus polyphemus]
MKRDSFSPRISCSEIPSNSQTKHSSPEKSNDFTDIQPRIQSVSLEGANSLRQKACYNDISFVSDEYDFENAERRVIFQVGSSEDTDDEFSEIDRQDYFTELVVNEKENYFEEHKTRQEEEAEDFAAVLIPVTTINSNVAATLSGSVLLSSECSWFSQRSLVPMNVARTSELNPEDVSSRLQVSNSIEHGVCGRAEDSGLILDHTGDSEVDSSLTEVESLPDDAYSTPPNGIIEPEETRVEYSKEGTGDGIQETKIEKDQKNDTQTHKLEISEPSILLAENLFDGDNLNVSRKKKGGTESLKLENKKVVQKSADEEGQHDAYHFQNDACSVKSITVKPTCKKHADKPSSLHENVFQTILDGISEGPPDEEDKNKNEGLSSDKKHGGLCKPCSRTLLKYIAVMQEFLDSVVVDVVKSGREEESEQCFWCIKERLQHSMQTFRAAKQESTADARSDVPTHTYSDEQQYDYKNNEESKSEAHLHDQKSCLRKVPKEEPKEMSREPACHFAEQSFIRGRCINSYSTESIHSESGYMSDAGITAKNFQRSYSAGHLERQSSHSSEQSLEEQESAHQQSFRGNNIHVKSPQQQRQNDFPVSNNFNKSAECTKDLVLPQPDTERDDQAYVTMATNNLCALGCMVLGNSLRLCKTTRKLVALVTDGVCHSFRNMLANVYDIVQPVRLLGSQGTTKIALLDQPELGVSFTKLHAWRLIQFSKCIFLDPDVIVIQNCDELFKRGELSAVPDIGWPDCFNSGVFVYVPSLKTFWGLADFAEKQENFDGGDQELLNMYFKTWRLDISCRLPFIYNLMANVTYTYKPAFKQFGRHVRIVNFFGSYKLWNVQFDSSTGELVPSANIHPTYTQFVQFWLGIFSHRVLPLFPENVQKYVQDSPYISLQDLLKFFPSPTANNSLDQFPLPPSFRVYPDTPSETDGESSRESSRKSSREESPKIFQELIKTPKEENIIEGKIMGTKPSTDANETVIEEGSKGAVLKSKKMRKQSKNMKKELRKEKHEAASIPGAEYDDFRGMFAWEQGHIDYLGHDSSENMIKRLDFLLK